ncbi:unnamed protein product [Dovyalis caffra]|uniref:Cytochrome P450 n=1 Tax=Dovyalis caffra TaxID=77055 RepID=A0AAV1SB65_9ROSI|nr:unnamed protein product [Dovyalis caffra]
MDLMLDVFDNDAEAVQGGDSDTINKATSPIMGYSLRYNNLTALIMAASDSTVVTLTWALSLLVNNPNILKKAHLAIDTYAGKERQVEESDGQNLVYLKAILKETLPLYPAAPLLIPHEATEDCTIDGYDVQKGTRLLANIWKIQYDPRVWPNPNEFEPQRFLTHKDVDVRGQNFEYLPFGSGRSMCPGVSFALQVMELTLATLIHRFDFETPTGEPINMNESIGLTHQRATPLEVLLSLRLPSRLYGQ